MIDVKPLQGQVRALVEDLRVRVAEDDTLAGELRWEYDQAGRAGSTGPGDRRNVNSGPRQLPLTAHRRGGVQHAQLWTEADRIVGE